MAGGTAPSRAALTALLEHVGATALGVDGELASLAEACRPQAPSLVVLDLGGDGRDLLRRVRDRAELMNVPILALATDPGRWADDPEVQSGRLEVIPRASMPEDVAARLQASLSGNRLQGELASAEGIILEIAAAFDARDPYRAGHTDRLSRMASRFGHRLGLGPEACQALYKGGILHDIGMLRVPQALVNKTGSLTAEELDLMKLHTVWGEGLCRPLATLRDVLPIIRHHHEQFNGKGYPDGLAGEAIPLLARIITVVDTFDSLCSDRPYRRRNPLPLAITQLRQYARRGWLDPELVEPFLQMVDEEGWPEVPSVATPAAVGAGR